MAPRLYVPFMLGCPSSLVKTEMAADGARLVSTR